MVAGRRAVLLCLCQWPLVAQIGGKGRRPMEGEQLVRAWLGAVDRVPIQQYVPVAGFKELPAAVQGNSSLWCERFFAPRADPNAQKVRRLSCHLATESTPDLLRHEYALEDIQLDVRESINFTMMRIGGMRPATAAEVSRIARTVLNLKDETHQWAFQIPAALSGEVWFSTNPDEDPVSMSGWEERADGGIHNGALVFLCFKKDGQRVGFKDIQGWFGSGFRPKPAVR
jgi:hypothetical protein